MNYTKKDIENIKKWDNDHVLHVGLPEMGVFFVDAEGAVIKDVDGKEYLDFGAQTLNVLIGHKNQRVIDAATEQMNKLSFCSMLAINEPKSKFAKLMYDITDKSLTKIYTVSGGSEVNESAMKLARRARSKVGATRFMSFLGSYHGATYGATSLTGQVTCKPTYVGPDMPGTVHVPMPYCYRCYWGKKYPGCELECAKTIENYIIQDGPDHYIGLMMEPIISAKGMLVPPKEYVQKVREITKKYGIILIFDEIVSGFARTGKMFGYEHFDIVPDILTLGKGISSGYAALAAMMVNEELGELGFFPYYHGFTMSGYPLANAIGYAAVKVIIDDNLTENSAVVGKYFLDKLSELKDEFEVIGDVRGIGLLLAIEIVDNKKNKIPNMDAARKVYNVCVDEGLLLHLNGRGDTVNLGITPPLIITKEQVDKAVSILRKGFKLTQ